jgi:hypothetical protein
VRGLDGAPPSPLSFLHDLEDIGVSHGDVELVNIHNGAGKRCLGRKPIQAKLRWGTRALWFGPGVSRFDHLFHPAPQLAPGPVQVSSDTTLGTLWHLFNYTPGCQGERGVKSSLVVWFQSFGEFSAEEKLARRPLAPSGPRRSVQDGRSATRSVESRTKCCMLTPTQ